MRFVFLVVFLVACGGSSSPTPAPSTCDSAQFKVTCHNSNGQCVEFSGLSTSDLRANAAGCDTAGTPCATTGRLGTCNIPPTGARTNVHCSPNASINIRYFPPFSQNEAQTACQDVTGATWTPN